MKKKKIRIKKCPHCGEEAYLGKSLTGIWWVVGCPTEDCRGSIKMNAYYDTEEEAATAWNERAEIDPTNPDNRESKWRRFDFSDPSKMPNADEKILVSDGDRLWMSVLVEDENGNVTIGGHGLADFDGVRWRKLPALPVI